MKKVSITILVFLALILLWEGASFLYKELLFVLPSPSKVLSTIFLMKGRFWIHTMATLKEMLFGFLLALAVAFPLATIMLRYKTSRTILQPIFIVIQCIPMFTLAPIMVIWFGWSFTAIIIPTALMIFFPLTLNIYQGLRATPQPLLDFFKVNQATERQTFFKLRLPAAMPHIYSGFRISAAIAGIGAVAGEWAGAQKGLGVLMLESRRNADLEITFGALLCLTLMSTTLYLAILLFEKRSKLTALLPICVAALLFTGCSHKKEETRLLLDWLPNVDHVPLYVGVEKGFFQEVGINLVIQKQFDSGGGIAYLTSKQADLLLAHLPGTLKACSKGADIKMVGQLIDQPLRALIYRSNLDVHTPSELSGKVLGFCLGGPDTTFLDYLLAISHVTPSERKNVSTDLISPLATGAVDFTYGAFWNVEPYQLSSLGIQTDHYKIQDLGFPSYQEMIIIASGESRESSPIFVSKFQQALERSIAYTKAHPEEAFELFIQANPDKTEKTIAWEKEAWVATCPLFAKSQTIDREMIRKFYAWQFEQKIITLPIDPDILTEISGM